MNYFTYFNQKFPKQKIVSLHQVHYNNQFCIWNTVPKELDDVKMFR